MSQFLGILKYYRELWPKRSEILAPLTELTKSGPTNIPPSNGIQLAPRHLKNESNHRQVGNTRLYGFLKKFTIHTDVLEAQLGAVITQEGETIYFHSKKLSKNTNKVNNDRKGTPNNCGKSQRVLNHTLGKWNRGVYWP